VNVAARLEQAAPPGEVYVGAETVQLAHGRVEVESVEPLDLKGKSEPVAAYRLVAVTAGDVESRRLGGAFVGRERERRLLQENFELSVRSEEHTSELQSRGHLVCRLLLE